MLSRSLFIALFGLATFSLSLSSPAADWPQWRGPNRDGKATDFKVPSAWPAELKQAWDVVVGDGVATPALVGNRLYVHSREGGNEVLRCLDAATGKEIWKAEWACPGSTDPGRFVGPRSSPAVGEGKVIAVVPGSQEIVLSHGEIKGFMGPMTMGYNVNPPSLLEGLQAGDTVRFTIDTAQKAIVKLEKLKP